MSRSSGKVILLGEHAVVHGVPAIAAGIDRGARASARRAGDAVIRLGEREARAGDGSEVGRAFSEMLGFFAAPPLLVDVELELPPGCGLGASAAIAVAVARSVLEALGEPDDVERVLAAASAWERVFHGNPSGIDAAAAAFGSCIYFTRAEGARPLRLAVDLPLAVAVAGPPASTREMVEGVAKLRERRPQVFDKTLEAIRALVENARLCIEAGDIVGLAKLMDYNQMLLSSWFLSTEGIERACHLAREAGALGAKLTGAGGGGCVIAVAPEPAPILEAWRSAGLECFSTIVAAGGAPEALP
jgi:mevalonate kinase